MTLSTLLREAIGGEYDIKKAKVVASGIAKEATAIGREPWTLKGAKGPARGYAASSAYGYTVSWYEKGSPMSEVSTMTHYVYVENDGRVVVAVYSNNHTLRSRIFLYAKRRGEIKKMMKPYPKAQPVVSDNGDSKIKRITDFLRGAKLGPAGRAQKVSLSGGKEVSWSIEPANRQRLDHYVGSGYWPGPDDDEEGWDEEGWSREYADPTFDALTGALNREFGKGMFSVDVGDKGYVYVSLTKKGNKELL